MLFPVHNPRKKKNQPEHSGCNSPPQVSKLLSWKVSGDAKVLTTKPVLKYKRNKKVERQKMEEIGYIRHFTTLKTLQNRYFKKQQTKQSKRICQTSHLSPSPSLIEQVRNRAWTEALPPPSRWGLSTKPSGFLIASSIIAALFSSSRPHSPAKQRLTFVISSLFSKNLHVWSPKEYISTAKLCVSH